MVLRNTFWVFVSPIQDNDFAISNMDIQESIGQYMLRSSILYNKIGFRMDLDMNPGLNHSLGITNLFDVP